MITGNKISDCTAVLAKLLLLLAHTTRSSEVIIRHEKKTPKLTTVGILEQVSKTN